MLCARRRRVPPLRAPSHAAWTGMNMVAHGRSSSSGCSPARHGIPHGVASRAGHGPHLGRHPVRRANEGVPLGHRVHELRHVRRSQPCGKEGRKEAVAAHWGNRRRSSAHAFRSYGRGEAVMPWVGRIHRASEVDAQHGTWRAAWHRPTCADTPKSASLIWPCAVSRMFPPLMSRWIMRME